MATFLQLVNRVLQDVNEPVITDVTSTKGVQTAVKNGIIESVSTIYLTKEEWPFLQADQTQALTMGISEYAMPSGYIKSDMDTFVLIPDNLTANGAFTSAITSWTDISVAPGAAAYTSTGNGRARLAGGSSGSAAITQSHTTIVGREYRISGRILGGPITCNIGTTSGGTEISSTSITITNVGDGRYFDLTFTATAVATFISFSHAVINVNYDVDYVEVREDWQPYKLINKPYDELIANFANQLFWLSEDSLGWPRNVTKTQDDKFLLYPVPHRDSMTVLFDAWVMPTDMAVNGDTPSIPDRYKDVIGFGGKIAAAEFRSDVELYRKYEKKFKDGIDRMVLDLIGKEEVMRAV
jgi:hypothetical protein